MPDEPGSRILLQHRVELLQTGVVRSRASRLRDLLKMNRDRHVQIGGHRVQPLHLRPGRLDLRFDFAETHRTIFDSLRQKSDGVRDCHVNTGESHEARWILRERVFRALAGCDVRQQHGPGHTGPVDVSQIAFGVLSQMKMDIQYTARPTERCRSPEPPETNLPPAPPRFQEIPAGSYRPPASTSTIRVRRHEMATAAVEGTTPENTRRRGRACPARRV